MTTTYSYIALAALFLVTVALAFLDQLKARAIQALEARVRVLEGESPSLDDVGRQAEEINISLHKDFD